MNAIDALPDRQIWSGTATGGVKAAEIGTFTTPLIRKAGAVATVGSALAARLVAALTEKGFTAIRTEDRHPALADIPPETEDYEAFSAGYGEIHSARELLQLVKRCNRKFTPKEDRWHEGDRVVDPFRPGLIYAARSDREFDLLTEKHLNAVRSAFRRCETLIVALSASEICESTIDGAVFPVWPGIVAGSFDSERHAFRTVTVEQTCTDLQAAIAALRGINPEMSIILMVSPEPMEATAMPAHVAAESFLGKAILRVAMDLVAYLPGVSYFPALEIVTGLGSAAFAPDGRTLSAEAFEIVAAALLEVCESGGISMEAPDRPAPPELAKTAPKPSRSAKAKRAAQSKEAKATTPVKAVDEYTIAAEEAARGRQARRKERAEIALDKATAIAGPPKEGGAVDDSIEARVPVAEIEKPRKRAGAVPRDAEARAPAAEIEKPRKRAGAVPGDAEARAPAANIGGARKGAGTAPSEAGVPALTAEEKAARREIRAARQKAREERAATVTTTEATSNPEIRPTRHSGASKAPREAEARAPVAKIQAAHKRPGAAPREAGAPALTAEEKTARREILAARQKAREERAAAVTATKEPSNPEIQSRRHSGESKAPRESVAREGESRPRRSAKAVDRGNAKSPPKMQAEENRRRWWEGPKD